MFVFVFCFSGFFSGHRSNAGQFISGSSLLTSISSDTLQHIGGGLHIISNEQFQSLSLDNLVTVGDSLILKYNDILIG